MLKRNRRARAGTEKVAESFAEEQQRAADIQGRLRGDYVIVEAERAAAIRSNGALSYATSDTEAAEKFAEFRQRDPFPEIPPALLNSADIADYVSTTGMIHPFDPSKLKSASYEVSVLGDYVIHTPDGGVVHDTLTKDKPFRLPRNSIAYLSVEPKFRLPDYIAVRHNLKIKNIYRGLLVGTGPLIDPGFVGRIALPLHNLTDRDYLLEAGEGTIWVEFTKLSPSPRWTSSAAVPRPRKGTYVPFPSPPTKDKGPAQYVNDAVGADRVPGSSTAEIAKEASQAKQAALAARNLTWAGFAAIIIGVAALITLPLTLMQPRIDDLKTQVTELEDEVAELRELQPIQPPRATTQPAPTPAPTP